MVSKKTDDLLELMKKSADGPRQQSPMEAMEGLACVWDNVECTDYSRIRDSTGEILEERLSVCFEDGAEILVLFSDGAYSWGTYPAIPTPEQDTDIIQKIYNGGKQKWVRTRFFLTQMQDSISIMGLNTMHPSG